MYRIFDIALECEFPLPELPEVVGEQSVIRVKAWDPGSFDSDGFEVKIQWLDSKGEVACWCERRGEEYLFVFPGKVRFLITLDGVVRVMEDVGGTPQVTRHLLLNQIVPRFLATTGRLVIHASAVGLANGRAVGFMGESGRGKSTLASSFHRHGAKLIDDDSVLLEHGVDGVRALGGFAGIRLFPDSVQAVFEESSGFTHYTPYTEKQQMLLKSDTGGVAVWNDLHALFLLEAPAGGEAVMDVSIEPVSPAIAMMNMMLCAFALDPTDKETTVSNFRSIGQAVSEQLGVFSLRYPRDHSWLPRVREAVEAWVSR